MRQNRNSTSKNKRIISEETAIKNTNADQDEAIQETANQTALEAGKRFSR
ncbi:hypothetical protein [Mesobacillus maritimus]